MLNDLSAPLPHYRFGYILQKALEMCAECRSLAGALLSALEKKDAEELSAIRANHETAILNMVKEVKELQLEEAAATRTGLGESRKVIETRYQHYQNLLGLDATPQPVALVGDTGGGKLITQESEHLHLLGEARDFQEAATWVEIVASILYLVPNFNFPVFGGSFGGSNIGGGLGAVARGLNQMGADHTYQATNTSILGGYARRDQEWRLQSDLAAHELDQVDKQIAAADIRIEIATQELKNHDAQITNSQQVADFLRQKFTNEDLYAWMQGEISTIYFQCYQMAYDLAKKAERTFRFERGLTESNFIQFGYWDSLRKGLLAGDRLYLSLKQMERAFHDQNRREYEITKHLSLMLNDPLALIALKETGQCEVVLPEALFDADYPGHYMRRLKSVSLTLPCVVGPYTSINCTLTLLSNKTRIKSTSAEPYPESEDTEDGRFVTNFAAMQSIATSHAQDDSGMFELNFRDERYLPFDCTAP